jgi:hypothetical protein
MPTEDDSFVALGPNLDTAAFRTHGANINIGADIAGNGIGVRASSDGGLALDASTRAGAVAAHIVNFSKMSVDVALKAEGMIGLLSTGEGNGVIGISSQDDGVRGEALAVGKSGVFGFNTADTSEQAFGVSGTCKSTNPTSAGVFGFADSANGVGGNSDNGNGVSGHSALNDGVSGVSDANGKSGVFGFNTNPSGAVFGVSGAVNSADGAGVNGFSDLGYGGHLRGGRAPLHLEPANTPGRPTTGDHQRGELFVDSNGDLFYCRIVERPATGSEFN